MDPVGVSKREMEKTGKKMLDLRHGDPVLFGLVNEDLSRALLEVSQGNWDMYPQNSGWINNLKEAIANFEKRERRVDCLPEEVIIAPGVAGIFREISFSLLEEGNEVVAFNPSHFFTGPTSYWSYLGARLVSASTDPSQNFCPDLDGLRRRIGDKTKAIVVNSPNNPTGIVYSERVLRKIVAIAGEYDIPIISDEIYGLVVFDGLEAISMAKVAGDVPVFVISGMSKVFLAPGWRIGYAYLHDPQGKLEDVARTVRRVNEAYGFGTKCLMTPILVAATRIYEKCVEPRRKMLMELQKRRDFAHKRLREIDGVCCAKPQGALYAFPRVEDIGKRWQTDLDFILDLMKQEGVIFEFGSKYGDLGFGHFRTLLLPDMKLQEEAYTRLERFLERSPSSMQPSVL